MPGCPRRGPGRPRSEEAERAILDAALVQLRRHGLSGLSIEGVAQCAGVAKTTVYRRWSNKTELIVAALAQMKGPLIYPPGDDPRADLMFLIQRAATAWRNSPETEIFTRMTAEAKDHPDLMQQYWERVIAPRRKITFEVLDRCVEAGLIRPEADLKLVQEMLMAPIIMAALHHESDRLTEERVEQLVDAVLTGWAP